MQHVTLTHVTLATVDRGEGPAVVLLHGFPLDHTMWDAQIVALADAGYRVIAPDLRGYGQSTLGPSDGEQVVSMSQYADDVAELLAELGVSEPVVIVGFSMGGYVALEFVQRYRQQVRALVLCDTRAAGDSPEAAENRHKMARHVAEWGASKVAEMMLPKLFAESTARTAPLVVARTSEVINHTSPAAIAAAQRGMATRTDFSQRLPEFDLPTLCLCGAHDAISPPDEMRGIAQALPQGKFVSIPTAGHMSPVENPAAVSNVLVDFLNDLP